MDLKQTNYIEVRPKSKLKYYFWSDPYRLPKNEEVLKRLEEKKVEFVVALGKHTMIPKCYNKIQTLIDNNIGINICILEKDFAHLDNSYRFKELYKELKSSKIFNDVKEIYIDAEISSKYRKNIKNATWNKKVAYVFNNNPSKKEYQRAIKDYNQLIDNIINDGKRFGIIRSVSATYEINKITRNVPFKEINEDLTVIMLYRVPEGKSKEYNDYWFYQLAKNEGINIFLGDIKDGYRSLRKDITICSYLKKKRVYIYDYYGFKKFCKIGDLKPYKSYKIKKDALVSLKHIAKSSGMIIADKFIKFFK